MSVEASGKQPIEHDEARLLALHLRVTTEEGGTIYQPRLANNAFIVALCNPRRLANVGRSIGRRNI